LGDGVAPGVVGLDGVTAVPLGEIDWPVAGVPPAGTAGPIGTLGAPGRDDAGDSAMGDGVVNDGTVSEAGGTPTVSADDPGAASGDAGALPSGGAVLAAGVPVGAGTLAVGEVPGAGAVAVGAAVVAAAEPSALPVPVAPGPGPGGVIGCVVAAPTCASARGAPPTLKQRTGRSMRASFPMIQIWILRPARDTSAHATRAPVRRCFFVQNRALVRCTVRGSG